MCKNVSKCVLKTNYFLRVRYMWWWMVQSLIWIRWLSCHIKLCLLNVKLNILHKFVKNRFIINSIFDELIKMTECYLKMVYFKRRDVVTVRTSSDTQGWFRSLHRPLGQLVEFPSINLWTNTIITLVSSSFSDE